MRFCRWYPLAEAAAHAPASEGVLQLRLAEGLLDYPRGKSAMVHYAHAPDVRAAAVALARAHPVPVLLCRHLEVDGDAGAGIGPCHDRLLGEFIRRFGAAPGFPP